MVQTLQRGAVVLANDTYGSGKRPFVIISDEDYPFYPHGYLGAPITSQDKPNTFEITEYDKQNVNEDLHINPSYINPYSPQQINDAGRTLMHLSDNLMEVCLERVCNTLGGRWE